MCIAFISFDQFSEFPLIIIDNRDEKIDRPTISLSEWEIENVNDAKQQKSNPKIRIFGGRDKLGGGTWFAISNKGKFCVLLNSYSKTQLFGQAKTLIKFTRGKIISDYLLLDIPPLDYINKYLEEQRDTYLPFRIIIGDIKTKENYFYDSHHFEGSKPNIGEEQQQQEGNEEGIYHQHHHDSGQFISLLVPGSSVDSDQDIISPIVSPTLRSSNYNHHLLPPSSPTKELKSVTIKLDKSQKMFGISNYPVHWKTFKVENGLKHFEKTLNTLFNGTKTTNNNNNNDNNNNNNNLTEADQILQSSTSDLDTNTETKEEHLIEKLFQILTNKETDSKSPAPYENINTSSIFVKQYQSEYTGTNHATVSSSILLVNKDLNAKFVEWDHIHSQRHLVEFQIQ